MNIYNEENYKFSDETKNDYASKLKSYYSDDLQIYKCQSEDLQNIKMAQKPTYSTEQKEDTILESSKINQFLYMDVGRWGGDKKTGDAWTRRRDFGLVCGSAAMLCSYDDPNISGKARLRNIDSEMMEHPDIKKMIPMLDELSRSNSLGPVTVVKALLCTDITLVYIDKEAETPSSDEILVFLGDIHAPVMNVSDRTYLQDTQVIKVRSCGRIKITDDDKNSERLREKLLSSLILIKKLGPEPKIKEISGIWKEMFKESEENDITKLLSKKISKNSFESQQLNSLDNNERIRWNDTDTVDLLKIILERLLSDLQLNEWDENERITEDNARSWFKHYHGNGENKGVDIFQNAGKDLSEFLNLLLNYQGTIKAQLIQLGDLYDFWLGLKRAFNTIQPQNMFSDPAAQSFLEFWRNETLKETSECTSKAIDLLFDNKIQVLNPQFVYGNHDSYRATPLWQYEKVSDHFESTGIWAEHGHQSDVFNQDSNAVIGWASAVFGFFHPNARNLEEPLRELESLIFKIPSRRLICIRHAACLCQQKSKSMYIMGHTHEPLLKKVHIVE